MAKTLAAGYRFEPLTSFARRLFLPLAEIAVLFG
jgi:hypothetical protein